MVQSDYDGAYPSSRKVYVEDGHVRVPMREVGEYWPLVRP